MLTVTLTVPAGSLGEIAVQLVVEEQLTASAAVVRKSTVVLPVVENPVPVIVTNMPPATGPDVGEIPVTVGGEGAAGGGPAGGGDGEGGGGEDASAVHWA